MQGKLSQSLRETSESDPGSASRAGLRVAIGFALTTWLLMSPFLACDGNGVGLLGSTSSDDESSFEWPEDPDHPRIRIDLTGAAGEGSIEIELMPELAPKTVEQILAWADEGYFDGMTFHRVIKDFMIQGGDPNTRDKIPTNDGHGGPGFRLEDEFSAAPFVRGVVGMGNTGQPNSAGSQFFIMQADRRDLDGAYTAIGRVRSGMEMVDAVVDVEIDTVGRWGPMSRPIENVVMTRVRRGGVEMDSESEIAAMADSPDASMPRSDTPTETNRGENPAPPASPAS